LIVAVVLALSSIGAISLLLCCCRYLIVALLSLPPRCHSSRELCSYLLLMPTATYTTGYLPTPNYAFLVHLLGNTVGERWL